MQYLMLFLEGIVTFISPCLLPMLPIYISYFAAGETDKRKTLTNSLGFVLGFTLVFISLGAFAGSIGRLLIKYATALNIITGLIVIVFGLNFLGVLRIGFLNRTGNKNVNTKKLGFFSSMLFGLVFSVTWTPCVGAFLGSALMVASHSGSLLQGVTLLTAFSLGLGIPFVASAMLLDSLKGTFDFIKRNYRTINIVSGILLIVIGLLMATGYMSVFMSLMNF